MVQVLNKTQKEFSEGNGNFTRTLAPAGSGKTTTLLWKCLNDHLLNNKNKYLIYTFTRVAKDELRDRVATLNEFSPKKQATRIEFRSNGFSQKGLYCHLCGKPADTSIDNPFCEQHKEYKA